MAAVLLSATPLPAIDQSWTGSAGTDFTTTGSWNPGGTLASNDDYYVNIVGTTSPILTTTATVGKLQIGENTYSNSSGKVVIDYGTLTANDEVVVGGDANTTATSYLEINGGTFTFARGVGGDVRVGFQGGLGQMNLTSYATVNINNSGRLFIGDQGGNGQLNVDSSTVTLANNVLVVACGGGAQGTVTLNNSSNLNINGGMFVGDGGLGLLTVADQYSTVTNSTGGNVEIGRSGGNGTLDLVGSYSQSVADMVIGNGAGSLGEVKVSGTGTFAFAGAGTVIVGNEGGKGTVTMSAGTFDVTNMTLGRYDNAQGIVNMTGGTINKTGNLCIGFDRGLGTMTMSAGTVLNSITGDIEIGRNSLLDNKLSMSGGRIDHSLYGTDVIVGMYGGKGTLEMTGGTFDQKVGLLRIGLFNWEGNRAKGYLNISGSAAYNYSTSAGTVYVGDFDCDGTINMNGGSMTLSNGATLKVGSVSNSLYGGSTGTITMNGGTFNVGLSAENKASNTYIGSGGGDTGRLDMSNGAIFNNFITGTCYIGDNAGTGTLTMVGTDPLSRTTFYCDRWLRVGNGGTGTIEMNQNSALNTGGYLVIGGGNSTTALGTLTMAGNAIITRTGSQSMFIGENLATGHGTMSDTSSITSSSADLEIGKRGGVGDLTMNNNSSIALDTRTLYVGYGGTGVVTMNDFSVVSTKNLRVGQSLVDDGTVETLGNGTLNMNSGTMTILTGGNVGIAATIGKNFADATLTPTTKTIGKMYVNGGSFANSIPHFVVGGTLGLNTTNGDNTTGSNHDGLFEMSTSSITTAASSGVVIGGTLGIQTKDLNTTTGSNNVGSFEMTGGTFSVGTASTVVIGGTYKTRSTSVVNGTGNKGTFHLDGGTFNIGTPNANTDTSSLWMGYGAGNTAEVTIDSGSFDASGILLTRSGANFGMGGVFTWTQNGGHTILPRVNTGSDNAVTTYNFNGGVFEVCQLRPVFVTTGVNGTSTDFNFNGGTIRAREITGQFIWSRGETTNYPGNVFNINVKSGGMIVDPNGIMGLGGNYGIIITTPLTSIGTNGKLIVRDSSDGNLGNLTLYGDSSAFVGDIDVEEGSLVGRGANALGFGDVTRTIKVNAGGKLGFRSSNTSAMYAGDFASTAVPTISVDGGSLFVDPYITFTGTGPWVQTFFPTRATVNNVTLKNATMTSSSEDVIGTGTTTYAWNINGTITSEGNSTINFTVSQNLACPNTGLIALQSGDMADPNTTFDVRDGVLTVSAPLTDGLSLAGVARATSLTKAGEGTMMLLTDASYTGDTTVVAGTLSALNIDTPAASVSVATGATLDAGSIVADALNIGGTFVAARGGNAAVPEPSMLVLIALAGLAVPGAYFRRR
jgi:autotransporter-associated beta strand protein